MCRSTKLTLIPPTLFGEIRKPKKLSLGIIPLKTRSSISAKTASSMPHDLVTAAVYQAVKKEKKPKTIKKQIKAKASDIYEDIK